MSLETMQRPTFVRLMLGVALSVLPLLAFVDYQNGYYLATLIDGVAAIVLLSLALCVTRLGVSRVARLTLAVVFVLAAIGSVDKLDSTPNLAWFPVMPVLYVFLGGLRAGVILTVCHYLIISAAHTLMPTETIDSSVWLQVSLAYFSAATLAISYEFVQERLTGQLRELAERDQLTGLLNRRGMEKRLLELSDFLSRHEVVVTLALMDIDHFKLVNDQHGHDVGDSVLTEISGQLTAAFRSSDYVSRWGGEEFLIALTRTDIDDAGRVLDRLRAQIANSRRLSLTPVTMSIGSTEWLPGEELDTALKRADTALYEAKDSGRNRITTARHPDLSDVALAS
jgi:diguanylate cyclase (GGDEF)-like protein